MASRPKYKNNDTNLLTFFAALCLYLSAVEYAVPKPLPFLRLGLANVPIMLALEVFSPWRVLLLTVLKIMLQAFISGTFFSYVFVFSAAGSVASSLAMLAVYEMCVFFCARRKPGSSCGLVSFVGISVAGAFANNLAQLVCARFILFGENTRYIAPVLLLFGLATGFFLGLFCTVFAANSEWYGRCCGKTVFKAEEGAEDKNVFNRFSTGGGAEEKVCGKRVFFVRIKFLFCMLSLAVFLFIKNLYLVWGAVFFFLLLDEIIRRGRVKFLPSLMIVLSVTFFALLTPMGKVLFSVGGWKITETALETGLHRSGVLVGMVFISQCALDKNLRLPGSAGRFIAGVFYYFDLLVSERIKFSRKNLVKAVDGRLLKICDGGVP